MMLLPIGLRIATEATTRQNTPNGRPRAGQLLQCALGQGNEQTTKNMNVRIETWEETCATLRMTPQRSPLQWSWCQSAWTIAVGEDTIFVYYNERGASREPLAPTKR